MAQNYSKKSSARSSQRNSQQQKSSFPVFLAGLVIGALGMHFLPVLLEKNTNLSMSENSPEQTVKPVTPDFQFTSMLKGAEIKVPETASKPKQDSNFAYLLQVGSFKNKPDAESLRVQLLLLNLEAFVEPFETSSGDTWYRVLVGPFDSDSKSASARAKLSDNNLESLLLKRNNSSNAQPTER